MGSKQPEQVLGRRIVNYLKNEATIGRITKQRLQVGGDCAEAGAMLPYTQCPCVISVCDDKCVSLRLWWVGSS